MPVITSKRLKAIEFLMNKRDKNNVGWGGFRIGSWRFIQRNRPGRNWNAWTKLARDNTRPLISAATEERADGDEPEVYSLPNLSLSSGKCLEQTSVIWQIARDRVGETKSFIPLAEEWTCESTSRLINSRRTMAEGRSWIDSRARQRGNEFRAGWL